MTNSVFHLGAGFLSLHTCFSVDKMSASVSDWCLVRLNALVQSCSGFLQEEQLTQKIRFNLKKIQQTCLEGDKNNCVLVHIL